MLMILSSDAPSEHPNKSYAIGKSHLCKPMVLHVSPRSLGTKWPLACEDHDLTLKASEKNIPKISSAYVV